jgi:Cupin domain
MGCPHGGIVVKGQMKIICDGKEEIAKAGDAFYFPPNHTGMVEVGTEVWESSPNEKLQKTMEVINRNMEAMMPKK